MGIVKKPKAILQRGLLGNVIGTINGINYTKNGVIKLIRPVKVTK